jgi:hypothetical protein
VTHTDQDQISAEIGLSLRCSATQDEAVRRTGYDPLQDALRRIHPVFQPIARGIFTPPMTHPGVDS